MAKESIKLSDSFGYKKLLRFTLPSIVMTVFTSVYSVVDGLFVSNFAGKEALAAKSDELSLISHMVQREMNQVLQVVL